MSGDTLAALFILAGTIGIMGLASIFCGEDKENHQAKEGEAK